MSLYKLTPSVQKIYDYVKKTPATPKMIIDAMEDETMVSLEPVLRGLKKMNVFEKKNGKWQLTEKADSMVVPQDWKPPSKK